jgi:hypothetical protein
MRNRATMLAITAIALMAASCGDSVAPTELPPAPPATQDPRIAGAWTGTYRGVSYECEALVEATFDENLGSVAGHIRVSVPCANEFFFQGTFQETTLEGVLVDAEGFNSSVRGTVSGATLEIPLNAGWLGSSRMNFHR